LSLGAMGRTVLVIIGLLVLIVGITNLISLYSTGDPDVVTPEWGLYLLTAGAIIGPLGIWVGIGRGRSS
ncbi:MAG TPA: hypothetical protein VMX37_07470, partial [Acidimicrobiia bacterium]|nr:hypothetical protein [Acidimicrobiia bacterium]